MGPEEIILLDLDHVLTNDGLIYRVTGNLESSTHFLGYNVYSPCPDGDRIFRGQRYRKNFIEDSGLPEDAFDVYRLVAIKDVIERREPVTSARLNSSTFSSSIWFRLYTRLADIFGYEAVGIFGSSMFGLHLTPAGHVRKDVDFVIQGISNAELLHQHLPEIRQRLGFTAVTRERQAQQHNRYASVFRNSNNSLRLIIARRCTGMQLSDDVVSTIRLRDPEITTPAELVRPQRHDSPDIVVTGRVSGADGGHLFPRTFRLSAQDGDVDIYIFWWKFSTPVRDGDSVTLCGNVVSDKGHVAVRLSNFTRHWLKINN